MQSSRRVIWFLLSSPRVHPLSLNLRRRGRLSKSKLVQMRYKPLHFLLIPHVVVLSHYFELGQLFLATSLPLLPNFFHNVQRWNIWHLFCNPDTGLSHEKHIRSQWFFRHLIQQSLVINSTQLCKLLWKPFFVALCCIFVLLALSFRELLPLLCNHLHDFCHFEALVFFGNHSPLFIAEEDICRLRLFEGYIFWGIEDVAELADVGEVNGYFFICSHDRTEAILLLILVITVLVIVTADLVS